MFVQVNLILLCICNQTLFASSEDNVMIMLKSVFNSNSTIWTWNAFFVNLQVSLKDQRNDVKLHKYKKFNLLSCSHLHVSASWPQHTPTLWYYILGISSLHNYTGTLLVSSKNFTVTLMLTAYIQLSIFLYHIERLILTLRFMENHENMYLVDVFGTI